MWVQDRQRFGVPIFKNRGGVIERVPWQKIVVQDLFANDAEGVEELG